MAMMNDNQDPLSSDRLIRIIHFQSELAKTRRDLGVVLQRTTDLAQLLTRADGAVVELVEGSEMVYRAASGIAAPNLGLRLPRDDSFSGLCVAMDAPLCCEDSDADPRVNAAACLAVGLRSMVVVPLHHGSACLGVLKVLASRPAAFGPADTQTLGLIAESIAAALAHAVEHGLQLEESKELFLAATRDRLTGLANRAYFMDQLDRALAVASRSGKGFALLMLDMDGLKTINDTCGHLAGDEAIRTLARRLEGAVRKSDLAARLGGDEFAVLLTSVQDAQGAATAAGKIVRGVDGPFQHEGRTYPLGVSLGCACFPEDADSAEALLETADQRMYAAKRARKAAR